MHTLNLFFEVTKMLKSEKNCAVGRHQGIIRRWNPVADVPGRQTCAEGRTNYDIDQLMLNYSVALQCFSLSPDVYRVTVPPFAPIPPLKPSTVCTQSPPSLPIVRKIILGSCYLVPSSLSTYPNSLACISLVLYY